MPIFVGHPNIPGAYYVKVTPGEASESGQGNIIITPGTQGSTTQTFTVEAVDSVVGAPAPTLTMTIYNSTGVHANLTAYSAGTLYTLPNPSTITFDRPGGSSAPAMVIFEGSFIGAVTTQKEIQLRNQDGSAFGPNLDVRSVQTATQTTITYTPSADPTVTISIDGAAYVASSTLPSPIVVTRPAAGQPPITYSFRGIAGGQTVTNTVTVHPIDSDTVTPDLVVLIDGQTATTMSYRVTGTNPKVGGALPTLELLLTGTTAVGKSGLGPHVLSQNEVVVINRAPFASVPGSASFTAYLAGGGSENIQRSVQNQDKTSFGPNLDVTVTEFEFSTYIYFTPVDATVSVSIDGGPYVTGSSLGSPIIVARPPAGGAAKVYTFRGIKDGQTITNSVTVTPIDADTITPNLIVTVVAVDDDDFDYLVSTANPSLSSSVVPTLTVTFVNCTGSGTGIGGGAGPYTIANNTTVRVFRQPFGSPPATVTFKAVLVGGGTEIIGRSVQNQDKLAFGPNLDVKVTPSLTDYTLTYTPTDSTVTLAIGSGAYGPPGGSPIVVARPAAGAASLTYNFRGIADGQTVTNSVLIPSIDKDTITPDLLVVPGSMTATQVTYTVSSTNPGGATAPLTQVTLFGTTGSAGNSGPIGDLSPKTILASGELITVNRPAFGANVASASFTAVLTGGGTEIIQRTIQNQDPSSFGPSFDVRAVSGPTQYQLLWTYDPGTVMYLAIDDGSYVTIPQGSPPTYASPILVDRRAAGSGSEFFTFKGVKDGQSTTNTVEVLEIGKDTVSPDLDVEPGVQSATTQLFFVTADNPDSLSTVVPAITVKLNGCTGTSTPGPVTIPADTATAVVTGSTVTVNRPPFNSVPASATFRASLTNGGTEVIRAGIDNQDKLVFGPSLDVTAIPGITAYSIYWVKGANTTATISVDGGAYEALPGASYATGFAVFRSTLGVSKTFAFKGVADGQEITNTVEVPSTDKDTVTPDLTVTPGSQTSTTQQYTITATNPSGAAAVPTITVKLIGCSATGSTVFGMAEGSLTPISSGEIVVINRPAFNAVPAMVIFKATLAGGGSEIIQRSVANQDKLFFGPTLDVRATPDASAYTITWSKGATTVATISVDGASYEPLPGSLYASGFSVTRPAAGGVSRTFSFKGVEDGQEVTNTVEVPSIDKDTITPDLVVTPGTPTTLAQPYIVSATNPSAGGATPTIQVTIKGSTGTASSAGPITDNVAKTITSGETVTVDRPAFGTLPASVTFVASLSASAGGKETIQRTVQNQDKFSFGPTLDIKPVPGASQYSLYWSGAVGTVITISVDGATAAASGGFSNPIVVTRPGAGAVSKTYTFFGTADGQTISNSVEVPSIDKDTVTPDLVVIPTSQTTTTEVYTLTSSNPGGGAAPSNEVTIKGSTGSTAPSGAISDGVAKALTASETITVNRPVFGSAPASVSFKASISGGGSEVIQRSVKNQDKLTFGPTLNVSAVPGATQYTINWSGAAGTTVTLSIDGGTPAAPPGTGFTVNRPAAGTQSLNYTFIGVADGQTVTNTIDIPSTDKDTVTPDLTVIPGTQSATTQLYTASAVNPGGGTAPTMQVTIKGSTGDAGAAGAIADNVAKVFTAANTITVNRPAFNAAPASVTFVATVSGAGSEVIQRSVPNQDKLTFGPSLTVSVVPGSTSYAVYWSAGAGDVAMLSIDNAAYVAIPGSLYATGFSVARSAEGGADKVYTFRAVADGQTATNTVTIPVQSTVDTVTPDLTVTPTGTTSTTHSYTVTATNPKVGSATVPTVTMTLVEAFSSGYGSAGPYSLTPLPKNVTIDRPVFGSPPGSVTFIAALTGGGKEVIQRSVPAREFIPPSLILQVTTGATSYLIYWTEVGGGTVEYSNGGAWTSAGTSPLEVQRNAVGGADKSYTLRMTVSGQTMSGSVLIPAQASGGGTVPASIDAFWSNNVIYNDNTFDANFAVSNAPAGYKLDMTWSHNGVGVEDGGIRSNINTGSPYVFNALTYGGLDLVAKSTSGYVSATYTLQLFLLTSASAVLSTRTDTITVFYVP